MMATLLNCKRWEYFDFCYWAGFDWTLGRLCHKPGQVASLHDTMLQLGVITWHHYCIYVYTSTDIQGLKETDYKKVNLRYQMTTYPGFQSPRMGQKTLDHTFSITQHHSFFFRLSVRDIVHTF